MVKPGNFVMTIERSTSAPKLRRFLGGCGRLLMLALLLVSCGGDRGTESGSDTDVKKDAKERVLSSGVVRAGYAIYPPASLVNPNTGELSGIMVDILEAAADSLELKVEWTEEVPWATMIEGLDTGRYDIIGSGVWANPARSKRAQFTDPVYFNTVAAYARADDGRFEKGIQALDEMHGPDLRIAIIDGEMSDLIAANDYPKATKVGLSQVSEGIQLLQEVATGKADVTFMEPSLAERFIRANPNSVRNIDPTNPVRVFPTVYMVAEGEDNLQRMLNVALSELVYSGYVERVIEQYVVEAEDSFLPVEKPYRVHEKAAPAF